MAKAVKVEKQLFEATLRKMINAKPAPRGGMPKSKKKLARIVEPISR
jgi:hypothetical protein